MGWQANVATIRALVGRSRNELLRVPGAAVPGILAPAIFFLGINGIFGALVGLRGFDGNSYLNFVLPVSMLQAAAFTGAATGVNLARDIEQGWLDRLLASPAPRWVLLAGMVTSAAIRAVIPATFVFAIAMILGGRFPGLDGMLITYTIIPAMAVIGAFWGSMLALKYKSQSVSPLMQSGMLAAIFLTAAYAPMALLQNWLRTIAEINPVNDVLQAVRQGFIGDVTWAGTWPGYVAVVGLTLVLGALALRQMRRQAV